MKSVRFQAQLLCVAAALVLAMAAGPVAAEHNYVPPKGVVPDAETAVHIAEAVLAPVYGHQVIESEKPFRATLKGETWTVEGSMHCERPGGGPHDCVGGVALVEVSRRDGRVTRITHGL